MSRNRYPGVYKRGNLWAYRQQFGDGENRTSVSGSGFESAKAANDAKIEHVRRARPLAGVTHRPDPSLTLAGYLEAWFVEHTSTLSPGTGSAYRSRVNKVAETSIGGRRLRSLKEGDYRTLVRELRDQSPSDTTLKQKVTMLVTALDAAVRQGLIASHPLRDIKVSRESERFVPGFWEPGDARKFLAHRKAAGDPLYIAWHLAIVTGMRLGELHGLRREDVDLDRGVLHIRRQRTEVRGVVHERVLKTDGSQRDVHLDGETVDLLRQHTWTSDYLVTDPKTGQPYRFIREFGRAWTRAVRRANVPRIRFHDLRHTSASLLADAGVPLASAQRRLGHMGPAMTARYTHAMESRDPEVAEAIGAVVAGL